jgi:DNA-binding IscR family transcriptional regulator
MSIKRSSSGRQPVRGLGADTGRSSTKFDKQELFDELRRRAEPAEPFSPADLATTLGVTETVASRLLLLLSADGFIERLEGGVYSAEPMKDMTVAQLAKELSSAAKNPQREKDLQDIARLKSNNDIMRQRLIQAQEERDRYLALLRQHGIDPGEPPAAAPAVPEAAAVEPSQGAVPAATEGSSAEAETKPITVGAAPETAAAPEVAPDAPTAPATEEPQPGAPAAPTEPTS